MPKSKECLKKLDIWTLLPYVWLALGCLGMLVYHLGPGKALIDGDMGGEMILSDLLNKEHDFLLSDNWYYATEIHVFFMQIVFRPLLLIWPNNWHIVRVVGMVIIYAVNLGGYLFMMAQLDTKKGLAVWSAAALMWPVGMWRLFLGLYGGQYLVYDFFACYIIGLILWLGKQEVLSKKMIFPAVMLAFLSLAGGVNGVRETMMLFMPICIGMVILLIWNLFSKADNKQEWKQIFKNYKNEMRLLIWLVVALFFNLVGYAYNLLVLLKHYEYQSNTSMVYVENLSLSRLVDSIADFFSLFGYGGGVPLFSLKGISSTCGIVLAVLLIFISVRLMQLRHRMSLYQKWIYASYLGGLFGCAIVFGLMEEMNEPRFWMPFMIFGFMIVQLYADVENFQFTHLRGIVGIGVALLVMVASVGTIKTQIDHPHEGKLKNLEMAQFLDQSGYTQGYTQFWQANTFTEQTSGRVQVRPLMYDETFEPITWSNRIDYVEELPEGDTFIILDKKSYSGSDPYEWCFYKYGDGKVVRDNEDWLMIVFDDAKKLQKAYEIALENGEVVSQDQRIGMVD